MRNFIIIVFISTCKNLFITHTIETDFNNNCAIYPQYIELAHKTFSLAKNLI